MNSVWYEKWGIAISFCSYHSTYAVFLYRLRQGCVKRLKVSGRSPFPFWYSRAGMHARWIQPPHIAYRMGRFMSKHDAEGRIQSNKRARSVKQRSEGLLSSKAAGHGRQKRWSWRTESKIRLRMIRNHMDWRDSRSRGYWIAFGGLPTPLREGLRDIVSVQVDSFPYLF